MEARWRPAEKGNGRQPFNAYNLSCAQRESGRGEGTSADMGDLSVRQATPADQPGIEACVNAAYGLYIERLGKRPAPMLADYAALITSGSVYVIDPDGIRGLIVLEPREDHLFIENVAVRPDTQGQGHGRRLMEFAEDQARRHGLSEIRLYTHAKMVENLGYYDRLGYEITERRTEDGYQRVFFRKRIAQQ